ncbi:MAG: DNRLRE domain-containing protein [Pirellulales bacterium]
MFGLRSVLVGSLMTLTALARQLDAATVVLNPSQDNTIFSATTTNSNGQGDLYVGLTNSGNIRRALLQFDIFGAIPAGATITEVSLTLREQSGNNGNRQVDLLRVTNAWGEGASLSSGTGAGNGAAAQTGDATWTSRIFNTQAWTNPGGDFSSTVSGSTLVTAGTTNQQFTWSSTASGNGQLLLDVQNWLTNPGQNFGWLLRGDESANQTAKVFYSGESAVPANLPALTITFTPATVPEPSVVGAIVAAGGLGIATILRRRRV